MANFRNGMVGKVATGLILGLLIIAVVGSFLPLVETNLWWIRVLDFPRLQIAITLVLLLAAALALRARLDRVGGAICVLGLIAIGYHAGKLYPYTSLAAHVAVGTESCDPDSSLTVMAANVQKRNEQADLFLELVAETDPDLLLVMETDAWWDRQLATLHDSYVEVEQFIPEDHGAFGMHILSKLPLISPEFLFFFDSYTPTVVTDVELPAAQVVQFIGVHPHPPMGWSQPSTLRDASFLTAALIARSSDAPTIIAGDFNAVPWEPVTRRAARIGGLLDPRIGRGLYATFSAENVLMSWPLDQILYQDRFDLVDFAVLPDFGSDHLAVLADLCHVSQDRKTTATTELRHNDISEARTSIEAARALVPEARR